MRDNTPYFILISIQLLFILSIDLPASNAEGQTRVVATTGMIADVAKNIAGERAQVTGLMGPGIDPHLYKATRSDMAILSRADLVLYNGLMLEGKLIDGLKRIQAAGRRVVAVAESIDSSFLIKPDSFAEHPDPHVWMDPLAWMEVARKIASVMVEVDPKNKDYFNANLNAYLAELTLLDKYCTKILSTVPKNNRTILTAHDAFNYFGRRFGFQVMGIQGISTESEAGVRDIENLVTIITDNKIPAVFVESTVSTRNINALVEGAAARGHRVRIGGSLFSDAFGKTITYEGTYIGMIDHNATLVTLALGGQTPPGGLKGKLSAKEAHNNPPQ